MLANILDLKKLTFRGNRNPVAKYRDQKLPLIGQSSRAVFLFGPYVIKYGSEWQAIYEIDFYDRICYSDQRYFPKLIAFDKKRAIVVQEYVPLVMDDTRITQRVRRTVERLIDQYNLQDMYAESMFNWGLHAVTGKPIIFDLGDYG